MTGEPYTWEVPEGLVGIWRFHAHDAEDVRWYATVMIDNEHREVGPGDHPAEVVKMAEAVLINSSAPHRCME
jgi:hypothetical protein